MDGLVDHAAAFLESRRLADAPIGLDGEAADFIHGYPVLHPVPKGPHDGVRIGGEGLRDHARAPAPAVLESLRQVPVEHGHPRRDAVLEHRVGEALVEIKPALVELAVALREDARPCERKPVVPDPKVPHQGEILLVPVVVIAGGVEPVSVQDGAPAPREPVPDGFPLSVDERGALDLGRGRGYPPDEIPGEVK